MTREKAEELANFFLTLPDEYTTRALDYMKKLFREAKVKYDNESHDKTIAQESIAQIQQENTLDEINAYIAKVSPELAKFRMENKDFYTDPIQANGFDEEIDRIFSHNDYQIDYKNVWEE